MAQQQVGAAGSALVVGAAGSVFCASQLFAIDQASGRSYFSIRCALNATSPNRESMEELYSYIHHLRQLPHPFVVRLDLTEAPCAEYILHLPAIIKELDGPGVSKCLEVNIVTKSKKGLVLRAFQTIVAHFSKEGHLRIVFNS